MILSIIVGVAIAFALGMLWYSKYLFGNVWMKLSGMTPERIEASKKKGMILTYAVNLAATIFSAAITYILVALGFGLIDIVVVWGAFSLPVYLNSVLWDGKPWKLFFINAGYGLLAAILMAAAMILLS